MESLTRRPIQQQQNNTAESDYVEFKGRLQTVGDLKFGGTSPFQHRLTRLQRPTSFCKDA